MKKTLEKLLRLNLHSLLSMLPDWGESALTFPTSFFFSSSLQANKSSNCLIDKFENYTPFSFSIFLFI
jgi:hypothetical protein